MLTILINAYACSPNMGSEPGMAWNWCINLAKYCNLHIITEGEFKEQIEQALLHLPQSNNLHFYYNPVSEETRNMCWNQGDWRFYKFYKEWQYKTYLIALDIIKNYRIDIIHQLNMIGFREPGYLWKIKGIPLVWGPVDAKEKFPTAYLKGASIKAKSFIRLKNYLTMIQLKYSSRVRKMVNRASFVISASSESQKTFNKFFNIDSPLINETGCYVSTHNTKEKKYKDSFDILWVGKMDFRKQLDLAIKTIACMENKNIKLHIVGGGDNINYLTLSKKLGITNQCIWYGMVSHDKVQELMQQADIFFFTSIAEGTPHVVLEAIANNLPVVCFDVCGQGDTVNEKIGVKIPASYPSQSIVDFANILNKLERNRFLLRTMSENCQQRQVELSWENKVHKMIDLYKRCF